MVRELAERLRKDGLKVLLNFGFAQPMSAYAFGSDWAQLFSRSQLSTFNPQPTTTPLNKERRFLPLPLDETPIKGSLAQFLYVVACQFCLVHPRSRADSSCNV